MGKKQDRDRQRAIRRYLSGESPANIYGSLGYSHRWFFKWLQRYQPGDEEWFRERSRRPTSTLDRTPHEIEEIVKMVRLDLYNRGLFCGAQAIQWEMDDLLARPLPSVRTINRILSRNELTHRRTGRYEPKGRKYPKLIGHKPNDVHQSDFVGPVIWRDRCVSTACTVSIWQATAARWNRCCSAAAPKPSRRSGRVGCGWACRNTNRSTTKPRSMAAQHTPGAWAT